MSDLDNAINSINASAAKAENTATFLDDMSTFDDQSSVTNPNNGQTVASIPKQVKDRTDELFTAAESDINQAVSDAAQSATDAQDAADSIGRYQGLWPDSGGSALKGDTYQTQVSGTPTGQYFTALQNTTTDPVGDDVNWREVVSVDSFSQYTDIVYKASGGNSAVENMIAGIPVVAKVGDLVKCQHGSEFKKVASAGDLSDFESVGVSVVDDFGAKPDGVFDNTACVIDANSLGDIRFSKVGSYNFTQNITLTGSVIFKSGAKIKAGGGIGITLDCSLPNQHVLDQSSDGLFVFENKDKFSGNFLPVMFGLSEFRTNNDDSIIFSRACSELNQIQEKYPPGTFNYETPIYYGGQLTSGNTESSPMIGAGRRITYLNKTSNKELTGVPNRFARSSAVIDNYNNIDAYIVIDHPNNGFRNFVEISGISFISSSPARVGYGIYSPRMALFNIEDLELRRCEVGYFTFDSFQGSISKLYGDNIGSKFIHFKNDGTGSGAGTTVHFDTCWVNGCNGTAFDVFGLSYSTMTNCAADNGVVSASDRVYLFNSCSGITMNGCGSENFSGQAATIYSASSTVVINGYRDLAHNIQGALAACLVVDGGRVTLNSCTFGDYLGSPEPGTVRYEYEVFSGGKLISNNTDFPTNFAQSATFASSSSGVVTGDGVTEWRSQGKVYSIGSDGPI